MDGMIRLYSQYKEALEKKSMGFLMSEWDEKLLKYGELFETKLMDLSVNIPLEDALDLGWEILQSALSQMRRFEDKSSAREMADKMH